VKGTCEWVESRIEAWRVSCGGVLRVSRCVSVRGCAVSRRWRAFKAMSPKWHLDCEVREGVVYGRVG
jgi:hypothetical protein